MTGFLLTLILIMYFGVCLFLILVILFQSGKGGGIAGMFGGGGASPLTDTFGASGAEKTLSKWTTYCAIAFLVFSLAITWLGAKQTRKSKIGREQEIELPVSAPVSTPETSSTGLPEDSGIPPVELPTPVE